MCHVDFLCSLFQLQDTEQDCFSTVYLWSLSSCKQSGPFASLRRNFIIKNKNNNWSLTAMWWEGKGDLSHVLCLPCTCMFHLLFVCVQGAGYPLCSADSVFDDTGCCHCCQVSFCFCVSSRLFVCLRVYYSLSLSFSLSLCLSQSLSLSPPPFPPPLYVCVCVSLSVFPFLPLSSSFATLYHSS